MGSFVLVVVVVLAVTFIWLGPMPGWGKPSPPSILRPRLKPFSDEEAEEAVAELLHLDPSLKRVEDRARKEWEDQHPSSASNGDTEGQP